MMKLRSHLPGLLSLNGIVLISLSRNFFTGLLHLRIPSEKGPSDGQRSLLSDLLY